MVIITGNKLLGQHWERFKNFQATRHPKNNVDYLEAEGYDIFVESVNWGVWTRKGFQKSGRNTS